MSQPHPIPFTVIPTLSTLREGFPGIRGLLFDMDGTLFDTERFHTRAFMEMGKDHRITPPHPLPMVHEMLVGKADHLIYEVIKEWPGFPRHWSAQNFVETKTNKLLDLISSVSPDAYFPAELRSLLHEARQDGIYLAVVTSSEKVITEKLLDIAGITSLFQLVLTRDDCPHHKPDPWPYRKALEVAGLHPHEAIIFEDSQVGITAARASGAHVVKVEWHPEFDINKV